MVIPSPASEHCRQDVRVSFRQGCRDRWEIGRNADGPTERGDGCTVDPASGELSTRWLIAKASAQAIGMIAFALTGPQNATNQFLLNVEK